MHFLKAANSLIGASYGLCPVWKQLTSETAEPHSLSFCISSVLHLIKLFSWSLWAFSPEDDVKEQLYLLGISLTFNIFSFLYSSLGKTLIKVTLTSGLSMMQIKSIQFFKLPFWFNNQFKRVLILSGSVLLASTSNFLSGNSRKWSGKTLYSDLLTVI